MDERQRTGSRDRVLAGRDLSCEPAAKITYWSGQVAALGQRRPRLVVERLDPVSGSAHGPQPRPANGRDPGPAAVQLRQDLCRGSRVGAGLPAGQVLEHEQRPVRTGFDPVAARSPDGEVRGNLPVEANLVTEDVQFLGYRAWCCRRAPLDEFGHRPTVRAAAADVDGLTAGGRGAPVSRSGRSGRSAG